MFLSVSDPIACRCTQEHPLADRHGNRELHEVFTSDRLAELPDLVSDEKTKRCPQDRFSAADLQAGAKAKTVLPTEQPHRCQCRVILPWLEKPAVEDHVDAGLLCHNRMFDLLKELQQGQRETVDVQRTDEDDIRGSFDLLNGLCQIAFAQCDIGAGRAAGFHEDRRISMRI